MIKNLIILPDGTEVFSGTGTVNAIQRVTLTQCVNKETELTPGSVCAAMLEADLITPGGGVSLRVGEEVELYRVDDAGNRSCVGRFILEDPVRPTANTMSLTGYDRISLLDKDMTAWLAGLDNWPYTLSEFAGMVCAACGLELEHSQIPNGDYAIDRFSRAGVTGRQLMQWIGQVCCRFCRANPAGKIELGWYTDSGKLITADGPVYFYRDGLCCADYWVQPVDAVQLRLTEGENSLLWPEAKEGANSYIISDNPLLAKITEDMATVLNTIGQQLSILEYVPCEVAIPLQDDIYPGQIVHITDSNGRGFSTLIMTTECNGQRMTLESTGSARRDSPSAQNNRTPEQLAAEAVRNLTQAEVFGKLTNGGQLQGLFMKDGQLYINASYLAAGTLDAQQIQVINLIAEKLKSVSENSQLTVDGASVRLRSMHGETFSVQNWEDGVGYLYMCQYDKTGKDIGRCQLGANRLSLGGTWTEPAFCASAGYNSDGTTWSKLQVGAVNPGKVKLYTGSCVAGESCFVPNTADYDLFAVRLGTDSAMESSAVLAYKNGDAVIGVGGWAGTSLDFKQLYFFSATLTGNTWTIKDADIHDVYGGSGVGTGTRMQVKEIVGVI